MYRLSKNMIHLCIIIVIIVSIIFTALILVLKYNEDGETNMPFRVSKISVISTVGAQDVENSKEKWNLQVNQNNDIYIYLEKNSKHTKTETIREVKIDNINIVNKPIKGEVKIYGPSKNKVSVFENRDEYISNEIIFKGDKKSDMQNLQISNQGGIASFRCANTNLGIYKSNEDDTVSYKQLLQKLNINNEELKSSLSFDLTIDLDSGVSYKSTCNVDLPIGDIVKEGRTETEIKNLDNIFKRIEK